MIGFIGAGKVGVSLGKYLLSHQIKLAGFYSSTYASAAYAAKQTNSTAFQTMESLVNACDVIFITVPDGVIGQVYEKLRKLDLQGKELIHCSGALSSEVFYDIEERGGKGLSMHPLLAIPDKGESYESLRNAYFTLEGNVDCIGKWKSVLQEIGNSVAVIKADDKMKYHAAAVFSSNLVIGLYEKACKLLRECGIDEAFANQALLPLFYGNCKNVVEKGVEEALTGPVERNDKSTIEKHLHVLQGEDEDVYRLLSAELMEIAKKKHPDRVYDCL